MKSARLQVIFLFLSLAAFLGGYSLYSRSTMELDTARKTIASLEAINLQLRKKLSASVKNSSLEVSPSTIEHADSPVPVQLDNDTSSQYTISEKEPRKIEHAPLPNQEEMSVIVAQRGISEIEKYVPLTQDQKDRIVSKFKVDSLPEGGSPSESLEDILGKEAHDIYRKGLQDARNKANEEKIEEEVAILTEKLILTDQQQKVVREAFHQVDRLIISVLREQTSEIEAMAKKNINSSFELFSSLMTERKNNLKIKLKPVLSVEQFAMFEEELATWDNEPKFLASYP